MPILICSCCGCETKGKQWWNQDRGYGICQSCTAWVKEQEGEKTFELSYGLEGKHYRSPFGPAYYTHDNQYLQHKIIGDRGEYVVRQYGPQK